MEIVPYLEAIEGWLSQAEGIVLYSYAYANKLGDIVEIGSYKGKSTCWLAAGIHDSGSKHKVYAIDPFTGSKEHKDKVGKVLNTGGLFNGNTFEDFKNNIERFSLKNYVLPGIMTSKEAVEDWDGPIGVLFIDGSHEYEDVRFDFLSWSKFVPDGGIIILHDTAGGGFAGPRAVVSEFLNSESFLTVDVGNMTIAQRLKGGYKQMDDNTRHAYEIEMAKEHKEAPVAQAKPVEPAKVAEPVKAIEPAKPVEPAKKVSVKKK